MIVSLKRAKELGVQRLAIKGDSQLVIVKVKKIMGEFKECTMEYIPQEKKTRADLLSKVAITKVVLNNRSAIQEVIEEPSIPEVSPLIACSVEQGQSWQQPILEYLTTGKVHKEEKEAKRIRRTTNFYTIMTGELYC